MQCSFLYFFPTRCSRGWSFAAHDEGGEGGLLHLPFLCSKNSWKIVLSISKKVYHYTVYRCYHRYYYVKEILCIV